MREYARVVFALTWLGSLGLLLGARGTPDPVWWKGNTHTHTLWSDGDGAPELVCDWYKSHGYRFLVLSDHNILQEGERWKRIGTGLLDMKPETLKPLQDRFGAAVELHESGDLRLMRLKNLGELRTQFEEPGQFLLIKGEEITDQVQLKPVHHGAINHVHLIKPTKGDSVREILERTVRAVEAEAAKCGRPVLLHLNHPNFGWAISPEDLAYVRGERFFEVYNGHRSVRNYGDKEHKSTEQIWDFVLSLRLGKLGGDPLYALATDDAHQYHKIPGISNPGRGWVMVRAPNLDPDEITRAMLAGNFYASSGVTLEEVSSDPRSLSVKVAAEAGITYQIRFIGTRRVGAGLGPVGAVLQESSGAAATYPFQGDELYVRAQVVSSKKHPNGYAPDDFETAWVQPVVVQRPSK
jgi:hypothetical protein